MLWLAVLGVGLAGCGLAVWAGLLRAGEDLARRRAQVEALSPVDKEELLEHQKRFARLSPDEQERLRRLNLQIDQSAQGPELRGTMRRYYDWLKMLPPGQQAELSDLRRADRAARIKKLLDEQAKKAAGRPGLPEFARGDWRNAPAGLRGAAGGPRLNPQDVDALLEWLDKYVGRQGKRFLENLPESKRREIEQLARLTDDPVRRHEILAMMWLRWQLDRPGKMPLVSDKDLAELRAKLSPETSKRLESKSADEQRRMISGMIPVYMFRQYAVRGGGRGVPQVSEEELAEFFEKELSAEERDRLLSLPGDDVQRELWRMYVRWKMDKLSPHGGRREGRPPRTGAPKGPGPLRGGPPGEWPRSEPPSAEKSPESKKAQPPTADGG
jgi:hypothetical protein